ncbi:MAG: hypothetical protein AB7U41_03545 [Dongiaceae bacterium]
MTDSKNPLKIPEPNSLFAPAYVDLMKIVFDRCLQGKSVTNQEIKDFVKKWAEKEGDAFALAMINCLRDWLFSLKVLMLSPGVMAMKRKFQERKLRGRSAAGLVNPRALREILRTAGRHHRLS